MPFNARSFASFARSAVRLLRSAGSASGSPTTTGRSGTPSPSPGTRPSPPPARTRSAPAGRAPTPSSASPRYAGDYRGPVNPVYAPQPDGDPDPGEVVWAWVPYEEDPTQGKDRPVLLIGRSGGYLLALMMTSRDRNSPGSSDPRYLDVGTGSWDSKGRPSEVRLDRVLQLDPDGVRREGAIMDRNVFQTVVRRLAVMRPAR
ncbi:MULTISPECIES: type II toxin-antitoxin system PemK/MazF family toxin [unclassified Arthrobacter]|uniref:type II toxin-antitoxin system PemK/MazF family toxin n=1 Tax=unclassified Arthrobacter TaxID=235627 RepID=UPI001E2DB5B4|nr:MULTISPECIES: type II toxin-antitoxin system PemK/MazF family toxin [unclassified Arthrobacter]MCC9145499.1 type II toxin-antitoxin system PemK/MazF family toxin [Arthrobacter sp. zg-Y919]MDK1276727.1 type II toxin-antitoxin system PemK/MazF family toxin [Arthrobacter sp. zg.Y919]WIB04329.1 type II toxin-antitoxin system PemK/MazF family toxin [Arthrobacter sp. zg-Y919]